MYQALYSTQDDYGDNLLSPLTAAQQAAVLSLLQINVLPGPAASSTLILGANDKTTRLIKIAGAVPFTLNSDDGVYHEGDTITATFTRPAPQNPGAPYWYSVTVTLTDGKSDSIYFATFNTSNQAVISFPAVSMYSEVTKTKVLKYFTLSSQIEVRRNAHSAVPSYLDSRTITLAVLPPGRQTFSDYQQQAWNALKDPKLGNYVTGDIRQRNVQITTLYANMFDSNQSAFEWSGIAAFASYSGGVAMGKVDRFRSGGVSLGTGTFNWTFGWFVTPLPQADELFKFLGEGNIVIFMDMYPQMLAYEAGRKMPDHDPLQFLTDKIPQGPAGLPANMQLVTPMQLTAWQKITDGVANGNADLVWQGNTSLTFVEQSQTIQAVFMLDEGLWDYVTSWKAIPSPIPGDNSTFQGFAPKGTSFFNSGWRVKWFTGSMVPAWKKWRLINSEIDVQKLLRGEYKKLDRGEINGAKKYI